jgi:hypothetical protein
MSNIRRIAMAPRRAVSLAFGAVFLSLTHSGGAPLPGTGQAGLTAATLKLFGDFPAFTCRSDVRLQEKPSRAMTTLTLDFGMLDGKVRMDLDMSTVKSAQIPQQMIASLKAAGLTRVVTVLLPERRKALVIYPGASAYAEIPLAPEEAADMHKKFRIEKTRVGKETVEGQSCEKTQVVLRSETGEKHEALVWYAKGLNDFPLRIQMEQPDAVVVMEFRDVKFARPESKQFEAPAGFVRYDNAETLMQNAMLRALSSGK